MSRYQSFCLFVLMLFPLIGCAQDDTVKNIDEYVEDLNALCPISYGQGWGVNSFTMVGDRYSLVDVQLPANLSMILSSLTSEGANTKRLWIKQLSEYGEQWNRFVDTMVDAGRPIVVNLRPEGSDKTALITLYPSDFKKE